MPRIRRPLLALIGLLAALAIGYGVQAARSDHASTPHTTASATASATVTLSALPPEVATTAHLIERGGPYPYPEDGSVFSNREHLLPGERAGYYHEYTVPTPGSTDRGTRRIITGAAGQFWYTGDHYLSFQVLDVTR